MAKVLAPRLISCYHCRHHFEVGGRTMSAPCPKCHKALMIEDVIVKNYRPVKTIQTCGKLIIMKGGRIAVTRVEAQMGMQIDGVMEAREAYSGGTVVIGAKAEWKGDCRAPGVVIKSGAKVRSGYFVVPDDPLQMAEVHARNAAREANGAK